MPPGSPHGAEAPPFLRLRFSSLLALAFLGIAAIALAYVGGVMSGRASAGAERRLAAVESARTVPPPSAEAEELFFRAVKKIAGERRAVAIVSGNHDDGVRLCACAPFLSGESVYIFGNKPAVMPVGGDRPVRAVEAGEKAGLEVQVLDEKETRELGMAAFHAVGDSAAHPPRLIVLRWKGGAPDAAPMALVGKGVCFDTGGYNLKSGAGIKAMRSDMAGAAAVTIPR